MRYQSRPGLLGIIAILIVVGGLGHTVILEVARRFKRRLLRQPVRGVGYSLNTRVVLRTSAALILIGALALLAFGMGDGSRPWGWRIVDALFQSVTARTAGFNSLAMSALPTASSLVIVGLMFIGGSPGSCAGGVKTTSVVAWGAQLRSEISGRHDATILGRRLPADMITRAAVVIGLAAMWTATGCVILSALELPRGDLTFRDIMFEQFSAFGTVGLSTGVTPGLSVGGKLWIIASMFVGRLGPLTAALAVSPKGAGLYRYPEERLMIG